MSPAFDEKDSPSERLKALELKAQAIRSRLTRVVDMLDNRRHRAMAMGAYARSAARPMIFTALGVVVVLGASVLAVRSLVRSRRRRRLPELASRAIKRLDLEQRPSFAMRLFEKAALSFATMAATELVNLAAKRFAQPMTAAGPRVA